MRDMTIDECFDDEWDGDTLELEDPTYEPATVLERRWATREMPVAALVAGFGESSGERGLRARGTRRNDDISVPSTTGSP
jgi:hypothetical protein